MNKKSKDSLTVLKDISCKSSKSLLITSILFSSLAADAASTRFNDSSSAHPNSPAATYNDQILGGAGDSTGNDLTNYNVFRRSSEASGTSASSRNRSRSLGNNNSNEVAAAINAAEMHGQALRLREENALVPYHREFPAPATGDAAAGAGSAVARSGGSDGLIDRTLRHLDRTDNKAVENASIILARLFTDKPENYDESREARRKYESDLDDNALAIYGGIRVVGPFVVDAGQWAGNTMYDAVSSLRGWFSSSPSPKITDDEVLKTDANMRKRPRSRSLGNNNANEITTAIDAAAMHGRVQLLREKNAAKKIQGLGRDYLIRREEQRQRDAQSLRKNNAAKKIQRFARAQQQRQAERQRIEQLSMLDDNWVSREHPDGVPPLPVSPRSSIDFNDSGSESGRSEFFWRDDYIDAPPLPASPINDSNSTDSSSVASGVPPLPPSPIDESSLSDSSSSDESNLTDTPPNLEPRRPFGIYPAYSNSGYEAMPAAPADEGTWQTAGPGGAKAKSHSELADQQQRQAEQQKLAMQLERQSREEAALLAEQATNDALNAFRNSQNKAVAKAKSDTVYDAPPPAPGTVPVAATKPKTNKQNSASWGNKNQQRGGSTLSQGEFFDKKREAARQAEQRRIQVSDVAANKKPTQHKPKPKTPVRGERAEGIGGQSSVSTRTNYTNRTSAILSPSSQASVYSNGALDNPREYTMGSTLGEIPENTQGIKRRKSFAALHSAKAEKPERLNRRPSFSGDKVSNLNNTSYENTESASEEESTFDNPIRRLSFNPSVAASHATDSSEEEKAEAAAGDGWQIAGTGGATPKSQSELADQQARQAEQLELAEPLELPEQFESQRREQQRQENPENEEIEDILGTAVNIFEIDEDDEEEQHAENNAAEDPQEHQNHDPLVYNADEDEASENGDEAVPAQQPQAQAPQSQQRQHGQNTKQRPANSLGRQIQEKDFHQQVADIEKVAQKRKAKLSRAANAQKENSRLVADLGESFSKVEEDRTEELSRFIGLGAGDSEVDVSYGVWTKGVFSKGRQRKDKDIEPFVSNQRGYVLGADILINDNLLLGAAYSNSFLNKKFEESDHFDQKEISSNIFGLYGSYNLTKNAAIHGQIHYGLMNLHGTRHEQDEETGHNIKTNGRNFGAKLSTSYNYQLPEGYMLMPKSGIAYSRTIIDPYQEHGAEDNILSRGKIISDRVTANAGLAVGKKIYQGDMVFVPMIYTNIEYAIKDKTNQHKIYTTHNEEIGTLGDNASGRFAYTFGAKLSAHKNNGIETSLNYEHTRRAKYSSHLGSIKLKVNF